jgi:segregation and condensation protein B
MTAPETYETVGKLSKTRRTERLSAAGLETLAVVAYRQPVTKAEIEAIRGVQCGAMLRTLVDRGLVRVTGRASQPGSPLQYGTTRAFLDRFGLASLQDLPRDGELLGE